MATTVQFNSAEYSADFVRVHHSYERYAYKQFKAALNEQVKPCIEHLKTYGSLSDSLIDLLVTRKPIESAYRTVYVKVGSLHAAWTMRKINGIGRKGLFSYLSEKWKQLMENFFINESAELVTDVTDTTRERIKKALADSEDLPMSQRATYLENTLDSPDFNRSRALTIARTETTRAANKGATLGNADADYETVKLWISVLDSNTRPTHVDADGQQTTNGGYFVVGGFECQYPGDVSLPAKEVCNCRCTIAFVPVTSADGLPILK